MKKTKMMLFILFLVIGILFLIPLKVSANSGDDSGEYLCNYLTEFHYGVVSAEILTPPPAYDDGETFFMFVDTPRLPESETWPEIDQMFFVFNLNDLYYFETELADIIEIWVNNDFQYSLNYLVYNYLGIEDFDYYLYWNFQEHFWQIDYFEMDFKDWQIDQLMYEKHLLGLQITDLQHEKQDLLQEIQDLQEALNSEYNRGHSEGYHEAIEEINALEKIVPSAFGSIWLVIKDFLSIEVLGIAIWEVIGAFVSVALAIIIIRMFIT